MADEATAPAEQAAETTQETTSQVRNPEAVLKQNEELLAEVKRLKKLTKDADGFDFAKARAALEQQEKAEAEHLAQQGEWEKLKEQLQARHTAEIEKERGERAKLLSNLHREKLTNALVENGVLADRAKYLVGELESVTEVFSDDNGIVLRKKGGIGDAAEFTALIENVKAQSPFFFAANSASGSGASGSEHSGSGPANTGNQSTTARLAQAFTVTNK